jgi:hypothetical protein
MKLPELSIHAGMVFLMDRARLDQNRIALMIPSLVGGGAERSHLRVIPKPCSLPCNACSRNQI